MFLMSCLDSHHYEALIEVKLSQEVTYDTDYFTRYGLENGTGNT
jgi:hypothetical protein